MPIYGFKLSSVLRNTLWIIVLLTPLAHATNNTFCSTPTGTAPLTKPVVFVTQIPISVDFAAIGSSFANHEGGIANTGRGGDLFIRYPSGKLCNLTREAGLGDTSVLQGSNAIAVRDPAINFNGSQVLFSMVTGAPREQYEVNDYYWQLYELTTGLAECDTASEAAGTCVGVNIRKVANQPTNYNNIMPAYGSDGRIIFVSDRPRNGQRHLYPQHDEYESENTNTGIWSLNPTNGNLILLQHSPSGSFSPIIDRFGRVIFTRWDHLQRDQQADDDDDPNGTIRGTFDYANESASATKTTNRVEVFPELRVEALGFPSNQAPANVVGLRLNHFFPWMINQDGTGEETLNHIGRHELHDYFTQAFNDDPNLVEFNPAGRTNPNPILNLFQIEESKTKAGLYIGVDAPEFDTHTSGQIISMLAPPGASADQITVNYLTHPDSNTTTNSPSANHSGHYRDPMPLADGGLLAAHAAETRGLNNDGSRSNPSPRYHFLIKRLKTASNTYLMADQSISGGITRHVRYYDPDVLVNYDGPLWELNPVEVTVRATPGYTTQTALSAPELSVFTQEGVDVNEFKQFLRDENLALMVVRDATNRDDADAQQPFNLKVAGNGGVEKRPNTGKLYDIAFLQYYQADQVRGIGGINDPKIGRRPLARHLHEPKALANNLTPVGGPPGSVAIAPDGSTAAFVPVRRALVWQTTASDATPVVRERMWINFQPGEIRVCDGCHGVNELNQIGEATSQNTPQALHLLLQKWKKRDTPSTPNTDDDSLCFPISTASNKTALICL